MWDGRQKKEAKMKNDPPAPPVHIKNIKNTEVRKSSIHGWGLFATKEIAKNTLMCVLDGQVLSMIEYKEFINSEEYSKKCFVEKVHLERDRVLAIPFRTQYSFINHDKKEMLTTTVKDDKVLIYAKKVISRGEEITSKYNLDTHIDVLKGFE